MTEGHLLDIQPRTFFETPAAVRSLQQKAEEKNAESLRKAIKSLLVTHYAPNSAVDGQPEYPVTLRLAAISEPAVNIVIPELEQAGWIAKTSWHTTDDFAPELRLELYAKAEVVK